MSLQFLHTMMRVGDLDAALDFFCAKLGLIEMYRKEVERGRFTLVFLAAPHDIEDAKQKSAPLVELTYNWDESDYDLMDNGVVINRPPRDGHMAFIKSPDGISIELLQKGDNLASQEPWASMENTGSW
jgi:lactoylglutathione lyase